MFTDDTTPIINGYPGDPQNEVSGDVPSDIEIFMTENGVSEKYSAVLRIYSPISNSYEMVRKFDGLKPDPDKIGSEFGPGKYAVLFSWKGVDGPSGLKKTFGKEFKFTISEAYREAYEDFVATRQEERQKRDGIRLEQKKQQAEIKRIETGGASSAIGDPIEAAERMLQKNLDMAIKLGQLNQPRAQDNILPLIISMQENSSKMMMQMMMGMMQIMGGQKPAQTEGNLDMIRGFMGMTKDLLLMKRDLDEPDEEKETMGEKIFNTLVSFAPHMLELANKSIEQRRADPLVGFAKGTKQYESLKDPAVLSAAVNRLDAKYSPAQTDKILETMELKRPEATKKNYEKYAEPEGEEAEGEANPEE